MAFPTDLTNAVDGTTTVAAAHQNALEAKVGIDGSAVTSTHDYKLSGVTGSDKAASAAATALNTTHRTSDGSDHSFIDQSVVSGATPTFTNTNFTEAADKNYVTDAEATVIGNTSGTNTGDEVAASATVAGVSELATIAEIDTGTDTGRTITPAGLAGSALQTKVTGIETAADVTDATNVAASGAAMAGGAFHDGFSDYAANEHFTQANITAVGTIATGVWTGTDIAVADGGTGASTAQAAIDTLTAVSAATNEHILTKDTASGNAIWKVNAGAGGGASAALDNLAAVAINTALISDTDITDDLGTGDIRWKDIHAATLNSGLTAADTLKLRARDVDGAAYVDILTITSANTVTADLNVITTIGGNAILDDTSTVSALTTVGTISSGTWEGTTVAVDQGGTGATSLTDGFVLLGSGTGAITPLDVTAKGSILVGDGTTDPVALAVGTNDFVLTADSAQASGLKWAAAAGGGAVATDAIWDAKGDLAGGTGANTAAKLTVGANDTFLVAASGEATGMKWVTWNQSANGAFTRNMTTATATQAITGLGFQPTYVTLHGLVATSFESSINGFSDATNDYCTQIDVDELITPRGSYAIYLEVGSLNSGAYQRGTIQSMDSDGFTIDWTKAGSPTGTAWVSWTASA